MATDIERLVVQLEANMRGYERSMQRAIGQTNQTARRMETRFERANQQIGRGFQAMGRVGVQALGALGVAVGGAQLARLATDALQAAEAIADTADRVGFATEQLQELRFAADQNGSSARTLDMALQRFSRRVGEAANGTGELRQSLMETGIQLRNSDGTMRTSYELLLDYADAIQAAESDQRALGLAFKAFDSEGASLVSLMRQGREGVEQFAGQARELGLVLEDDIVRQGAEANAAIRAMRQELQATFNRGVLENVEGIESLAEAISGLVQGFLTAIGAAHRLGLEIRDLVGLNDLVPSERAQGFSAAAGQVQDDMTVGQLRQIITRELSSDEAGRFLESIGANGPLLNNPATGTNFRPNDDLRLADVATRSPAQIRDLLQGFADGARTQARIVDELEDVEVPRLIGGGGGGGGSNGGSGGVPVLPSPADVGYHPGMGPGSVSGVEDLSARKLKGQMDAAREMGVIQAEEYAREMERRRSDFAGEFASTIAGGWIAAFDGNLAEFAAQRLRDALYDRLFELFNSIGRQIFDGMQGGGGGFLASAAGAVFGGGKATGGPVRAGYAYRVGERGPETIIPAQSGMVIPAQSPMRPQGQSSGPLLIKLEVGEGEMFDVRVRDIAGPMAQRAQVSAVRTVRSDLQEYQKSQNRALKG